MIAMANPFLSLSSSEDNEGVNVSRAVSCAQAGKPRPAEPSAASGIFDPRGGFSRWQGQQKFVGVRQSERGLEALRDISSAKGGRSHPNPGRGSRGG